MDAHKIISYSPTQTPKFLVNVCVCNLKIDWLEALNTDEDDFGFIENSRWESSKEL